MKLFKLIMSMRWALESWINLVEEKLQTKVKQKGWFYNNDKEQSFKVISISMFSTLYNLISRYNRSALPFSNMYFVDQVNLPVVEDSIVSWQGSGESSLIILRYNQAAVSWLLTNER